MHELGLAQGILTVALDAAQEEIVRRVRVRVGRRHRVVPDSLDFSFHLLAEDTVANDARLEVVDVPATLRCAACGAEAATDGSTLACPSCGSGRVEVTGGDEIMVDEVELDGSPPTIIRREDAIVEEAHAHAHE